MIRRVFYVVFYSFSVFQILTPSVFYPFLTPKHPTMKQTINHFSFTHQRHIHSPNNTLPITNQRRPLFNIKQPRLTKNNPCPTLRVRHPYFDSRITFLFDCAIFHFFFNAIKHPLLFICPIDSLFKANGVLYHNIS
jgi:hypothetical protein